MTDLVLVFVPLLPAVVLGVGIGLAYSQHRQERMRQLHKPHMLTIQPGRQRHAKRKPRKPWHSNCD